jgi:predicted  nucleic acid-binding Zn-ribbon protein
MRTHITYLLIIIGLAVVLAMTLKGGCKAPATSSKEYKDLADTVTAKNRLILAYKDSMEGIEKRYSSDNEKSSEIIASLMAEKETLKDVTVKLKSSVTDITGMYREARKEADTALALLYADNQANICDAYVWQSQRELYVADSLIRLQQADIAKKESTIQKQIQFKNDFLSAANSRSNAQSKQIFLLKTENKKLNNWWNRWGKEVVVGTVAGFAGYGIGQAVK